VTVVAGIDYSMSSPALCIYDTDTELKFENLKMFSRSEYKTKIGVFGNVRLDLLPEWSTPEERYHLNALWVRDIFLEHGVQEYAMEGYSMGSSSGLVFNIAENGGALKQMLWKAGIVQKESPSPSTVKKYHSGKGNSKKEPMVDAFNDLFMVQLHEHVKLKTPYVKPVDDLTDAWAVLNTAFDITGPKK
jgi:Holliday junction resolvasome RuvABC endonuclease subunit